MLRRTLLAVAIAVMAAPASAQAQGLDLTCQLGLTRLDSTTTNVLALDTNAEYWGSAYVGVPGTRIRISGHFPYSRYMSWNVYDTRVAPADAAADFEIAPDPESANPFLPGADRFALPRRYTLFVEFGPQPAEPAPNTLYTGDSRGGLLVYRVYIPDAGRDGKGGVPIPSLTVEPQNGAGGAPTAAACGELQAPYAPGVNELIASAGGLPDPTDDGEGYPGRNPPDWELFRNLSASAVDILTDNTTAEDFHEPAQNFENDGPGFMSNLDIAYVFTGTSRGHGRLLVLEGRAPTFPDTRDGARRMRRRAQLRYWSICQYEPATQRVIDCRSDDQVTLRRRRRYTIVVSNADDRPANARPECGVTWLAWGPQTQGLLIYRHLLAHPDFEHAIQRIPEPGLEEQTLGPYNPGGEYLPDRAAFESRGCPAS